jgi:hypothetical protein
MTRGSAQRVGIADLAGFIAGLKSDPALALGALRPGLPSPVRVVTRRALNGATSPDVVSRTMQHIVYRAGQPGFVLFDIDTKSMPREVAVRLEKAGGLWAGLTTIVPALERTARLVRASTSAGIFDERTGREFAGSGGQHIYAEVKDVADSGRFLRSLHARCWLHGYGWMMVGRGGQLLERLIVDCTVGSPARLGSRPRRFWARRSDSTQRRGIRQ